LEQWDIRTGVLEFWSDGLNNGSGVGAPSSRTAGKSPHAENVIPIIVSE
jgi:hypothetical protein